MISGAAPAVITAILAALMVLYAPQFIAIVGYATFGVLIGYVISILGRL